MLDFIPKQIYTPIFHYTVLLLVLFTSAQCYYGNALEEKTSRQYRSIGILLVVVLTLYMGLRPAWGVFGDTVNYAYGFREYANNGLPFRWEYGKVEWLFYNLMQLFAKFSDLHSFFLLCAVVYVVSLWWAMERMFKHYSFIPFLVLLSMFTFWNYGVNGVRNGMGASLFILAMSYVQNLPVAAVLCALGVGMHSSVLLMIGAAVVAWFYKNSYHYLALWGACVLLSLIAGGSIQSYLAGFSMFGEDERFSGYLSGDIMAGEVVQVSSSFRWDFLLYSSMGVIVGWYFIFKRKFWDEYYHWIYNTFLMTNAFWVLIIRASYSNRFAQISWFIMPVVLIYPFLKRRFWPDHEQKLGAALLLFYAFTFYFNIIKGG